MGASSADVFGLLTPGLTLKFFSLNLLKEHRNAMNDRWRNRIVFWLLCTVPFFLLVMFLWRGEISAFWFMTLLLVYALIYRPIVHVVRLRQLDVIEPKDTWKLFIPFYQTRYISQLWLG